MLLNKHKKAKGNRVLITVNVLGSAGPLRFVVNEGEVVAAVIDMALKSYAREGRLPVLGSNLNDFVLHCPSAGSDALSPLDTIGAHGARNFLLYKKPQPEKAANVKVSAEAATATAANITRRGNGSWKSWINKTIILKIASH